MSATLLAAEIVAKWKELSRDSAVNRETMIRNLLLEFQHKIVSETLTATRIVNEHLNEKKN